MKLKVHELTNEELTVKYAELKEELFNLRFRQATGQLENPKQIHTVKKNIARVLTEANFRKVDITVKKVKKPVKKAVKKEVKAKAEKVEDKASDEKKAEVK